MIFFFIPCSQEYTSKKSRKTCCCHYLSLFPMVEIWVGFGFVTSFVLLGLVWFGSFGRNLQGVGGLEFF